MSDADKVLSEFITAWNAGRRPRVRQFLARVPAGRDRDGLAEEISTFLQVAPTPSYSEQQRAEIRESPAVRAAYAAVDDDAGAWPAVLPGLRNRAGLSVSALAGRLLRSVGLGEGERQRTVDYLERLERGELEAERLSRRLIRGLGDALGVAPATLAQLGGAVARPVSGGIAFRVGEEDPAGWVEAEIDRMSRAALTPARPSNEMDELERLFCGGPDA